MKALKVYYAHAMCLYRTEQENNELKLIREKFKDAGIVNPADHRDRSEEAEDAMNFYLSLVDSCDIVVFSHLLGKVTSGVGKEVNHALNNEKDAYMINEVSLISIKSPVKPISRQSTIELYRMWMLQNLGKT